MVLFIQSLIFTWIDHFGFFNLTNFLHNLEILLEFCKKGIEFFVFEN